MLCMRARRSCSSLMRRFSASASASKKMGLLHFCTSSMAVRLLACVSSGHLARNMMRDPSCDFFRLSLMSSRVVSMGSALHALSTAVRTRTLGSVPSAYGSSHALSTPSPPPCRNSSWYLRCARNSSTSATKRSLLVAGLLSALASMSMSAAASILAILSSTTICICASDCLLFFFFLPNSTSSVSASCASGGGSPLPSSSSSSTTSLPTFSSSPSTSSSSTNSLSASVSLMSWESTDTCGPSSRVRRLGCASPSSSPSPRLGRDDLRVPLSLSRLRFLPSLLPSPLSPLSRRFFFLPEASSAASSLFFAASAASFAFKSTGFPSSLAGATGSGTGAASASSSSSSSSCCAPSFG
mmetsp:Transcript_2189/g.5566  ORF Transcript_2189/g.5566 Transcript_2189/m.5566 type:complete len:355 (-) Transcript_2189:228-1292(-)